MVISPDAEMFGGVSPGTRYASVFISAKEEYPLTGFGANAMIGTRSPLPCLKVYTPSLSIKYCSECHFSKNDVIHDPIFDPFRTKKLGYKLPIYRSILQISV